MKEQIERRLMELRQEYEAGERMRAELDARRRDLGETMLRIGGAMQVLTELLEGGGSAGVEGAEGTGAVEGSEVPIGRRAASG